MTARQARALQSGTASERAYFDGDHCQHVAARDEHERLNRLSPRRAHRPRHETPLEQAERYGRDGRAVA